MVSDPGAEAPGFILTEGTVMAEEAIFPQHVYFPHNAVKYKDMIYKEHDILPGGKMIPRNEILKRLRAQINE